MKKTLVLSMMLCGSVSLVLAGCAKDDQPSNGAMTAGNTTPGDGDQGDGDQGDGDGGDSGDTDDQGDGDGDDPPNLTFVPVDDIPGISECDPFGQDCPEGEKCVPYGSTGGNWDANKCVPVTGSGAAGDACTYGGVTEATDDCDAGTHCWDIMEVDGANVGVCTPFCTGTADDPICEPGTSCLIANDGSIALCITICDPLLQDCGAGLGCFWANNGFNCIFTTQDIPEGEPCGYINDCIPGNVCLSADVLPSCAGSACCGGYCDLTDPTCLVAGTECSAFFEEGMAMPGDEDIGVCIIPGG